MYLTEALLTKEVRINELKAKIERQATIITKLEESRKALKAENRALRELVADCEEVEFCQCGEDYEPVFLIPGSPCRICQREPTPNRQ